jgi:hypothetical protein
MRSPLVIAAAPFLALPAAVCAHPIPDVPVQAIFDDGGAGTVRVEFDLRFIDPEPATAPYFKNEFLADKPPVWRTETIEKALAFITTNIEFFLESGDHAGPQSVHATPDWQWEFTGQKNAALATPEDPVMLTATWRIAPGAKGYRIRSTPDNKWSVLFLNTLRGKELERTQVLFPGENSFTLDLTAPTALAPAAKADARPWWRRLFGT